ncbi:hypothetical protein C8F04DRAFT_975667, partial [Mycena alexandri]
KITSITCDNASSNDVMARTLETLLPDFDADKDRTRCFAHIINLVAKSLLKMFDPPKNTNADGERDDDDEDDAGTSYSLIITFPLLNSFLVRCT